MEKIQIGMIGLGARGLSLLKDVVLPLGESVTAVCDTYQDRTEQGGRTGV